MPDKSRRKFLRHSAMISMAAALGPAAVARAATDSEYFRIATEETFGTSEVYDATAAFIAGNPTDEVGLGLPPKAASLTQQLLDLGDGRLAAMDAGRIDMQLLSLWSPGVQIFGPQQGTELAKHTNELLAAAIGEHPDRFAGLTTIAPQDPAAAAMEIERGMSTLKLNGVLINSYTKGEYLDDRKFWPIFEAAQANDATIYMHPRKPPPQMYAPFADYSMEPFASCCAAFSTNFRSSGLRLATWEKVCLSGSTGSTRSLPGSSSQQSSANPATISEIILSSRPAECSGIRSWSYLSRYSVLNASCSVSITRSHPAMLARVGSMTHRSATKTEE